MPPTESLPQELLPDDYPLLLESLKSRIQQARLRAATAANKELILLYWHIGSEILQRQKAQGWGAKVVAQLAADLKRSFPDMQGFSPRNLLYMRAFAEAYPEQGFVQQSVAQIPWGHHVRILDKAKTPEERAWYARACQEFGWSRDVLMHQIETRLFDRRGKAITNFEKTLPAVQSDLAQQILKDPYRLDFLGIEEAARERELQEGLMVHLRQFLLELGVGFAFVGSHYRLEIGGDTFEIDLLFYHLKLRCFVVIDLKIGKFQPDDAGQMGFYLSAVDDLLRHPADQPTIGLILCKSKNAVVAEYALRGSNQPIGVSEYQLTESLPSDLQSELPTIAQIESELADIESQRE